MDRSARKGILRYSADRRALFLMAVHAGILAGGWLLDPDGLAAAGWIAFAGLSAFVQLIATHNALHSPLFRKRALNRAWQTVLSMSFCYPASSFVAVHNLSHHRHLQTPKDVLRTTEVRHRWNLLNLLGHTFGATLHVHICTAEYLVVRFRRNPRCRWVRQVMLELGVVVTLLTTLCFLDASRTLLFIFLPAVVGQSLIIGLGFVQHDGCYADDHLTASRNFTSPILNWLICNNGYHTIHHVRPSLHWSLGKVEHEKLEGIDPRLNEPSIFAYMWRAYIHPGSRRNFDGTLVNIDAPRRPREVWIPQSAVAVGASSGAVDDG